jgi:hypothetical protein
MTSSRLAEAPTELEEVTDLLLHGPAPATGLIREGVD